MEVQIHLLEQEAYCSVLRAFLAQSDSISWDQLELITHLRRELRVSDSEHKELYGKVKDDEAIQKIKEWRLGDRGTLSNPRSVHASVHTSSFVASYKKQKASHSGPSFSFDTAPSGLQSQSHSATKRGLLRGKGKTPRLAQPFYSLSSVKPLQHPSSVPMVNGQFMNHNSSIAPMETEPHEATASHDPLIGRKVCMRWPEDNSFYEAVITDYNPSEGRHALVYDANTAHETWEWVDLKEVSPEDIRWVGEGPKISRPSDSRATGLRDMFTNHCDAGFPAFGNGSVQSRKDFPSVQNGTKKVSNDIEIVNTNTIIKEVESILGVSNPDPQKVEEAKRMLKKQEEALVDAIAKLTDASDGESGVEFV